MVESRPASERLLVRPVRTIYLITSVNESSGSHILDYECMLYDKSSIKCVKKF